MVEYIAAARALKSLPVDFLLAGAPDEGSLDAIPLQQLDSWARKGAPLLGHVDDMSALLQTVDILVLPTKWAEGVPRVLLEGAAASAALIATDRPDCREVIEHNVSGLLVPEGDVSPLTAALRTLILDPGARVRLGKAARRKIEMEFGRARSLKLRLVSIISSFRRGNQFGVHIDGNGYAHRRQVTRGAGIPSDLTLGAAAQQRTTREVRVKRFE